MSGEARSTPAANRRGAASKRAGPLLALAVFVMTLVVGAIACEVLLRTTFDPKTVLDGDAMWEVRWRESHAASNAAAGLHHEYGFDRFDANLGWRPKANYRSDDVRTNSAGIRADREYLPGRAPGTRRIVVLGDSFIWGEEVSNQATFVMQLEGRLPETEAINLGVHGYGTDQQLLRLRESGLQLEPDLVVLGFYEGDLSRNVLSFRDFAKPMFHLEQGELVLANTPVPSPETVMATDQELPASFLLVTLERRLRKLTPARGASLEKSEEWRVTRAILAETERESRTHGARFVLVYIPYDNIHERSDLEPLLASWAEKNALPYLSLREEFVKLPLSDQERLYRGHWTPFGNAVVADIVARFIESERLLPEMESAAPSAAPQSERAFGS